MATFTEFRNLALSLPEATEQPHFEKTSFRIKGAIFATYEKKTATACVKLSLDDQSFFSSAKEKRIYPVANSWGTKGWTLVESESLGKARFIELFKGAYSEVTRKKNPKSPENPVSKKPKKK